MSYKYFKNTSCKYFPCHKVGKEKEFNCLFCFCPLYQHKNCGGNYKKLENGLKDCSDCIIPHKNYEYIVNKLKEKGYVGI